MSNNDEPEIGSWVIASVRGCPSRYRFERRSDGYWHDSHGCYEPWGNLIEPIDTLVPEEN